MDYRIVAVSVCVFLCLTFLYLQPCGASGSDEAFRHWWTVLGQVSQCPDVQAPLAIVQCAVQIMGYWGLPPAVFSWQEQRAQLLGV